MREFGIGLVGYGFMGKTHTFAYKTLPLYYAGLPFRPKLAGICSTKTETVRLAMDEGYTFGTTCFDELLSRDDIDIIDICTPNVFHYEQVMAAIRAGKHIYCEKPLAISGKEAGEMASALKAAGLLGQMAMQYRFFPATLRAKQLIDSGHIGNLMSFRAAYLHSGSIDPDRPISWKLDRAVGGGVLFDLGSHVLNLIHYFLGNYSEVFAATRVLYPQRPSKSGESIGITADDAAFLTLRIGDAIGTVEVSKIATGTNDELSFEIFGDRGAMRFNLMDPSFLEFFDNNEPEAPLGGMRGFKRIECVQRYEAPGDSFPSPKSTPGWLRAHVHGIYTFLDCVYNSKPVSPSFDDAAYVQNVMDAAYRSAVAGRWIKLTERGEEL